ncbi:hypothetical protein [Kibdelosporangium aridum]|uniref:Uncharacterized protein n=1 Tax=Kibdelosporangium aridum TaxID=2030 RepID=A0A1W2FGF0_KIBAR|nr:hypothetical protein [Kibdelosporangium aridum]SMD20756.1 hypothetical protein SAMN05661093_06575 [Kibdelosporangium aridum]
MADWKTDAELYDIANRLGRKIIEMYSKAGVWISAGLYVDTLIKNIVMDAETYMSLEPQRIIDEFERMQKAARDTGEDAVSKATLNTAAIKLGEWTGAGAEAFMDQMNYIQTFMEQQNRQILFAAHCMGTAYSLAVNARRNYYELADATIAACDKEMKKQAERDTKATIGILSEIATACITGFGKPDKAATVVRWGLESFVAIGAKTGEVVIEGSEAPEVVSSYTRARSNLESSFHDGLAELTRWIEVQERDLAEVKNPILEPLQREIDVTGADFDYGKFFHDARDPAVFGAKVEQERKKIQEEQNRPPGLIGQRLDGGPS